MAKSNGGATGKAPSAVVLDFTDVRDAAKFTKRRKKEGDYKALVSGVEDSPTKESGEPQWLYTLTIGRDTYPYYCKLVPNQLWKLRNLNVAAGQNVPKKKVKLDPKAPVGASIGVTLEDDDYEGRAQSVVAAVFPLSELDGDTPGDDEEESVEAPQGAKKGKKKDKKGSKVSKKEMEELDIDDV